MDDEQMDQDIKLEQMNNTNIGDEIEEQDVEAENSNAYEVAILVAKNSGLIAEMQKDQTLEGLGRIENVNALLDGVKEFVENDEIIDEATMPDKTITSYLQNIAF